MDSLSRLPNSADGAPLLEFPSVGTTMLCPPTEKSNVFESPTDGGLNPLGARSVSELDIEFPSIGTTMLCPPTEKSNFFEPQTDGGLNTLGARSVPELETGRELDPHGPLVVLSAI